MLSIFELHALQPMFLHHNKQMFSLFFLPISFLCRLLIMLMHALLKIANMKDNSKWVLGEKVHNDTNFFCIDMTMT